MASCITVSMTNETSFQRKIAQLVSDGWTIKGTGLNPATQTLSLGLRPSTWWAVLVKKD